MCPTTEIGSRQCARHSGISGKLRGVKTDSEDAMGQDRRMEQESYLIQQFIAIEIACDASLIEATTNARLYSEKLRAMPDSLFAMFYRSTTELIDRNVDAFRTVARESIARMKLEASSKTEDNPLSSVNKQKLWSND
jgi:hypothetical protein